MLLKIENINKSYGVENSGNFKKVLNNVSLELPRGETLAILGPSGSGKSTLLNIIGTLDKPDSGEIIFDGLNLNTNTENDLSLFRNKEVGFVFQSHHLLPQCTVLENVLIPTLPIKSVNHEESREKAIRLVKEVDLWDLKDKFPDTLSGGECQRVAVVRALINNPKLILADEPTGSLDHRNALSIISLLLKLNSEFNTSLIIVTHSTEIGSKMNKTYNLVDGELVLAG